MHIAYLLLGSNIGESKSLLAEACLELERHGEIDSVSALYITAPWGRTDQPPFLNQALKMSTALHADAFLTAIQTIEQDAGRERSLKWGPRTLDIDILLFDDLVIHSRRLQIPHPRMTERRFALTPLAEIAGDILHPERGLTIKELLLDCPDHSEVAILAEG